MVAERRKWNDLDLRTGWGALEAHVAAGTRSRKAESDVLGQEDLGFRVWAFCQGLERPFPIVWMREERWVLLRCDRVWGGQQESHQTSRSR